LPLAHQQSNTAWAAGKGFEVVDGTGAALTISSAAIQGSSVVLTLAPVPAATASLTVRYAITQDGTGNQGGTAAGLIGQLRDSDDFVGYDAETLTVGVTAGSTSLTSTSTGAFLRRAGWDDVSGAGVAAGTVVVSHVSDDALALSNAWSGASGQATLSFHHDERNYAVHFTMPVASAGVFSLWPYVDNVGVSDDGAGAANFDGLGFSYSSEALAAGGAAPGGTITAAGFTFTWPNEPSGLLDNVEANGQSLVFASPAAKTTLGLLGSATNATAAGAAGTLTVEYADGTTEPITVTFTDWTRGGGTTLYPLVGGNVVAITSAHRDEGTTTDTTPAYVYAFTAPLGSSKPVTGVILPANVTNGHIHIFDLQLQ